jgi:hypothetical protein
LERCKCGKKCLINHVRNSEDPCSHKKKGQMSKYGKSQFDSQFLQLVNA